MKTCKFLAAFFLLAVSFFTNTALAKSGDIIVSGTLEALSTTSVTVNGTQVQLTSSTEYRDKNDHRIHLSDFAVGDLVKVKALPVGSDLIAREMEQEVHHSSSHDSGGSSGGSSSSNSSDEDDIDKEVNLLPLSGVLTSATGSVERKLEVKSKKTKDRVKAKLKLPLPSTVPAVATADEAQDALVTLELSRSGTAYASCTLAFDRYVRSRKKRYVEYKLDVRSELKTKNSSFSLDVKKGTCDIDLLQDGTQVGVPDIESGDSIKLNYLTTSSEVELLGASF